MMDAKTVIWTSPPKLYRIEDRKGRFEIAWITDETLAQLIPMYAPKGYTYTLLAVCMELDEEIVKFRKDKSRTPITQDDIADTMIDLYLVGKNK